MYAYLEGGKDMSLKEIVEPDCAYRNYLFPVLKHRWKRAFFQQSYSSILSILNSFKKSYRLPPRKALTCSSSPAAVACSPGMG